MRDTSEGSGCMAEVPRHMVRSEGVFHWCSLTVVLIAGFDWHNLQRRMGARKVAGWSEEWDVAHRCVAHECGASVLCAVQA